MFIKYNLPRQEEYEGDWDWEDSLRQLSLLVRQEIEKHLPIDFLFRGSVPENDDRLEVVVVDCPDLPRGVANILSDYLSSVALAVEIQPDKWLKPELKACPFCGGEGKLTPGRVPVLGSVYLVECSECGAKGPHGVLEEYAMGKWNDRVVD